MVEINVYVGSRVDDFAWIGFSRYWMSLGIRDPDRRFWGARSYDAYRYVGLGRFAKLGMFLP